MRSLLKKPILEACVDSYVSARAAAKGGADRLELCANLPIGGTTPSRFLFEQIKRDFEIEINVLIRPRFGDFLYSDEETEQICKEIELFRDLGADGVVVGALTARGELDAEKMARFLERTDGMNVTLHRAFDMTRDPFLALETAIKLGCHTILTSGQAPSALKGKELLKELFQRADGRIDMMAGSGVNSGNLRELFDHTGITTYHASAKKTLESGMEYRKAEVSMGLPSMSEYEIWQTDENEIGKCRSILHSLR